MSLHSWRTNVVAFQPPIPFPLLVYVKEGLWSAMLRSVRSLIAYQRLLSWEHEVLNRGVKKEAISEKIFDRIPWSGVAMFAFMMVFFGIDLAAGIKHTAQQMKDKKAEAESSPIVKSYKQKQWSVEQAKQFREGDFRAKHEGVVQTEESLPRPQHVGLPAGRSSQQPRNGVF